VAWTRFVWLDGARSNTRTLLLEHLIARARRWCGKGFTYRTPDGQRVLDKATVERVKQLVIPPAWQDVWIAPIAHAHIQAVGRDDRGRKQYIYHPEWARIRDEAKFDRMIALSEALPGIRSSTHRHLRKRGLPREKVLATVVRLLGSTYVRIGNPEYARQNDSFALTTLRDRHVDIEGSKIHFEFRGKRGVEQKVDVRDPRLARVVRECLETPGYTLFQYYDEDRKRQPLDSGDVNEYLRMISGGAFTAKDFRTGGGTLRALLELFDSGEASTKTQARKNVVEAVKRVAKTLGNQPCACRKYYIHPQIPESCLKGELLSRARRHVADAQRSVKRHKLKGLEPEEWVMLQVLADPA